MDNFFPWRSISTLKHSPWAIVTSSSTYHTNLWCGGGGWNCFCSEVSDVRWWWWWCYSHHFSSLVLAKTTYQTNPHPWSWLFFGSGSYADFRRWAFEIFLVFGTSRGIQDKLTLWNNLTFSLQQPQGSLLYRCCFWMRLQCLSLLLRDHNTCL